MVAQIGDPLSTTEIDPGASAHKFLTPGGTGPLGHPVGNGQTWGDPGTGNDGSVGGGVNQQGAGGYADASGIRSR